jgi:hypothetical protein
MEMELDSPRFQIGGISSYIAVPFLGVLALLGCGAIQQSHSRGKAK